jgi:hypothetical protein
MVDRLKWNHAVGTHFPRQSLYSAPVIDAVRGKTRNAAFAATGETAD